MSILKIPAEVVGNFTGDYEPADFARGGSIKGSFANGGASAYPDDEFESDDDQQVTGTLGFDEGYDCKLCDVATVQKTSSIQIL